MGGSRELGCSPHVGRMLCFKREGTRNIEFVFTKDGVYNVCIKDLVSESLTFNQRSLR